MGGTAQLLEYNMGGEWRSECVDLLFRNTWSSSCWRPLGCVQAPDDWFMSLNEFKSGPLILKAELWILLEVPQFSWSFSFWGENKMAFSFFSTANPLNLLKLRRSSTKPRAIYISLFARMQPHHRRCVTTRATNNAVINLSEISSSILVVSHRAEN